MGYIYRVKEQGVQMETTYTMEETRTQSGNSSENKKPLTADEWKSFEQDLKDNYIWKDNGDGTGTYTKTENGVTLTWNRTETQVDKTNTISYYQMKDVTEEGTLVRVETTYTRVYTPALYDLYQLYTFGSNNRGQLAQDTSATEFRYPTLVDFNIGEEGESNSVLAISGGKEHLIALKQDGYMWASGANQDGQLGNVTTEDSRSMVMVGQQRVTARPSTIVITKGQTINITRELIKGRDVPLTVTYEAGINLLLKGNSDEQVAEPGQWSAASLNTEILEVRRGSTVGSFVHPDYDVVLAERAEAQRSEKIELQLVYFRDQYRKDHPTDSEEQVKAAVAAERQRLTQDHVNYGNEYVNDFIANHPEYVAEYKYSGYRADGSIYAPTCHYNEGDYYITGKKLGQTMIQVRVPGLSASAYVTVRVMQDNSSKANPMVALGEDHTLALKADGTVWSWGSNDRGQLGREDYATMGQIIFPHMIEQVIREEYLTTGKNYFEYFGIKNNQGEPIKDYLDWYTNSARNADFVLDKEYWDDADPVQYIAAGNGVSFAITATGRAYAWGVNDWRQLGVGVVTGQAGVQGTNVMRPMYMVTPDEEPINGVAATATTVDVKSTYENQKPAGYRSTTYLVGVKADGTEFLMAAGYGFTDSSSKPVEMDTAGMGTISQVSGGYALAGGEVWKLGNQAPTKITGFTETAEDGAENAISITQIAAGANHLLALDATGHLWAMGSNTYGQLGIDEEADPSKPSLVLAGEQSAAGDTSTRYLGDGENGMVTEIAAGLYSSYVRTNDDKAYAWGANDRGQLGLMAAGVELEDMYKKPKLVPMVSSGTTGSGHQEYNFLNVFGGFRQGVYMDEYGMLWGAGANTFGQLANGTSSDTYENTLVGDSALRVTIADSYTTQEGDGLLYLGDYVKFDPSKPETFMGKARYRLWTEEDGQAGVTRPASGFIRDDGFNADWSYKGEYIFDRDAKRVVSAGELTLIEDHTYYLDTDFDVFCLFVTNNAKFDYTYGLSLNNNEEKGGKQYRVENPGDTVIVVPHNPDEKDEHGNIIGSDNRSSQFALFDKENNRVMNTDYMQVVVNDGTDDLVNNDGWFTGIGRAEPVSVRLFINGVEQA